MLAKFAFSMILMCCMSFVSCPGDPPPPPQLGSGFFIQTNFVPLFGPIVPAGFIDTHWDWVKDITSGDTPRGNTASFDVQTNLAGVGGSNDGRVPAVWKVTWITPSPDPLCAGKFNFFQSDHPERDVDVNCFEVLVPGGPFDDNITAGGTYIFSPALLYTDNSVATSATISGTGFSSQYGMPIVRYFDSAGNLANQATATSIAPDGTWIKAGIPDLSAVVPGAYNGLIYNANASGGYTFIGTTAMNVIDNPTPPSPICRQGSRPIPCE